MIQSMTQVFSVFGKRQGQAMVVLVPKEFNHDNGANSGEFLAKYFPPAITTKMGSKISLYNQQLPETLYEEWERSKDLLRICVHHSLSFLDVIPNLFTMC